MARRALDAVVAVLIAAALIVWWTGGGRIDVFGVAISARSWIRPAVAAIVLVAIEFALTRADDGSRRAPLYGVPARVARIMMGALLIATLAVTFTAISYACGGLDSHGYVAFSQLLAEGKVARPMPDASWLPLDDAAAIVTPLGFIPSPDGRWMVPEFPPGAPLAMALARSVAGPNAVFLVGWLASAALALLVFLVARRRYDTVTGLLAAIAIAAQPVAAAYSLQAMSDLPATLWTALAVWLMTGISGQRPAISKPGNSAHLDRLIADRRSLIAVAAGLAGSLAILTRPPLGLAMLVVAGFAARRSMRTAAIFFASLLPGVLALMLLQNSLYGSPFVSGHGGAAHLFTFATLPHNLWAHMKWLLIVDTPLLVPFVWLGVRADRIFGRQMLALFAAVALPYLFYGVPFDDWEMNRFLLPGLVLLTPLAAHGIVLAARRIPSAAATPLAIAAASLMIVVASARWLDSHGVFELAQKDSKFPRVGEWVTRRTDAGDVVLAALHSGSVNYYSGRQTLRWDVMPPDRLGAVVAAIRQRGQRAYLVLDEYYEMQAFNRRFPGDQPAAIRVEPIDSIFTVQIAELIPQDRHP